MNEILPMRITSCDGLTSAWFHFFLSKNKFQLQSQILGLKLAGVRIGERKRIGLSTIFVHNIDLDGKLFNTEKEKEENRSCISPPSITTSYCLQRVHR